MDFRLDGRTAFVTGAARGIGRCIAETLRDQGARTIAGDLAAPEIDGVLGVEVDVTSEGSVADAFARVESEAGSVDLLVLNAGIMRRGSVEETSLADWRAQLDVNLTGAFLCARRALPSMRERQFGRIVIVGSSAGITGAGAAPPALPGYAASKAGVMALAKAIASEYAEHGITSNAVAPTMIRTEMTAAVPDSVAEGVIPMKRFGTPEEVAGLVSYLCSTPAAFITGEVVDINGGFLID